MATPRERLEELRKKKRLAELQAKQAQTQATNIQDLSDEQFLKAIQSKVGDISSIGEAASVLAGQTVLQPIAGLSGIGESIREGSFEDGSEEAKRVQSLLQPGEEAKKRLGEFGGALKSIAEIPGIDKIVEQSKSANEFLQNLGRITGSSLQDPFGTAISLAETGEIPVSIGAGIGEAIAKAAPQTALEVLGARSTGGLGKTGEAIETAGDLARQAARRTAAGRQAAKVGVDDLSGVRQQAQRAEQAVEGVSAATGQRVGLFPAQRTLAPTELLKQRLLPQLDASAAKATNALEKQNKQVFDATTELISKVAPRGAVEGGSARFRKASQLALDASKERRSAATSDLFTNATRAGADVDVSGVRKFINDAVSDAPAGKLTGAMNKVKKMIEGKPSLARLDKAKDEINELIEAQGSSAVSKKTKRLLVQVKRQLVNQMETSSPQYKEAMDKFRELSPSVEQLENSIVGQVSKIDDVSLKNISQRIFDPKAAATDPAAIRNAKLVIEKIDPGAFDDLLKVELNRRVGGLTQAIEEAGDLPSNVPGQLRRAIFGNPSQRNALLSGMTQEQRKNFVYLETVLKRAEKGRSAGSPTAQFQEAKKQISGVAGVLRDKLFRPIQALQETGETAVFDRNAKALADVMFDTDFAKQMEKLRKLNPDSPQAAAELDKLMKVAEGLAGATALAATKKEAEEENE